MLLFNVALNLGGASRSGTKPKEEVGKYRIGWFCLGSPDYRTEETRRFGGEILRLRGCLCTQIIVIILVSMDFGPCEVYKRIQLQEHRIVIDHWHYLCFV